MFSVSGKLKNICHAYVLHPPIKQITVTPRKPLLHLHFLAIVVTLSVVIVKRLLRRSCWCHFFLLMAGVRGSASHQNGSCHLTDE